MGVWIHTDIFFTLVFLIGVKFNDFEFEFTLEFNQVIMTMSKDTVKEEVRDSIGKE